MVSPRDSASTVRRRPNRSSIAVNKFSSAENLHPNQKSPIGYSRWVSTTHPARFRRSRALICSWVVDQCGRHSSRSAGGSDFRSSLPFGVNGIASSQTNIARHHVRGQLSGQRGTHVLRCRRRSGARDKIGGQTSHVRCVFMGSHGSCREFGKCQQDRLNFSRLNSDAMDFNLLVDPAQEFSVRRLSASGRDRRCDKVFPAPNGLGTKSSADNSGRPK